MDAEGEFVQGADA
jgi:hypothetical protein